MRDFIQIRSATREANAFSRKLLHLRRNKRRARVATITRSPHRHGRAAAACSAGSLPAASRMFICFAPGRQETYRLDDVTISPIDAKIVKHRDPSLSPPKVPQPRGRWRGSNDYHHQEYERSISADDPAPESHDDSRRRHFCVGRMKTSNMLMI